MKITDELRMCHNLYVSTGVYKTDPATVWKRAADEIDRLTAQLAEARDEAYALKLAAAGGEDVPGSAQMVTPEDVERWAKDNWTLIQDLRAQLAERNKRIAKLEEFVRHVIVGTDAANPRRQLKEYSKWARSLIPFVEAKDD